LNVFFLAMPVKSGIAALLIIFYLVFLVGFLRNEFFTPGQIRVFYSKIFE
jgi:type III secretion protein T